MAILKKGTERRVKGRTQGRDREINKSKKKGNRNASVPHRQQNRSDSLNTGKEAEKITKRRRYGHMWDIKITKQFRGKGRERLDRRSLNTRLW